MKHILPDRIINIEPIDSTLTFCVEVPIQKTFGHEISLLDGNTQSFEALLANPTAHHIEGLTTIDQIHTARAYYESCGFFDSTRQCFAPDLSKSKHSFGVHIFHLARSTKEKNQHDILPFLPLGLVEPGQQKALRGALNHGVISTISLTGIPPSIAESWLVELIEQEAIFPPLLAKQLYFNYEQRGYALPERIHFHLKIQNNQEAFCCEKAQNMVA
jgi:hypothetical protein